MAVKKKNLDSSELYIEYSQKFLPKLFKIIQSSIKGANVSVKIEPTIPNITSIQEKKKNWAILQRNVHSKMENTSTCEIPLNHFHAALIWKYIRIHSGIKPYKCDLCSA